MDPSPQVLAEGPLGCFEISTAGVQLGFRLWKLGFGLWKPGFGLCKPGFGLQKLGFEGFGARRDPWAPMGPKGPWGAEGAPPKGPEGPLGWGWGGDGGVGRGGPDLHMTPLHEQARARVSPARLGSFRVDGNNPQG